MSAVLGLDPARTFGWALRFEDGSMSSGAWEFRGLPWGDLYERLTRIEPRPSLIVYERQAKASGLAAAHLHGGFRAVIEMAALRGGVPYLGVRTSEWRAAAGLPSAASKAAVMAAARSRWPGVTFRTHDEAEARWIAEYGWQRWRARRGGES